MTHFLVENFLWLQNHFLGNRFPSKIFMETFFVENWYRCKIISSKTGYCKKKNHKKNVWWKIAKSFPRKQVPTKNFHQKFLVENF